VFKPNEDRAEATTPGTFQSINAERPPRVHLVRIWDKATPAVTGVADLRQPLYVLDAAGAAGHVSSLIGDTKRSVVLGMIADDLQFGSKKRRSRTPA
jgi:hypothetical protein